MAEQTTTIDPESNASCLWPGVADQGRARLLALTAPALLVVVALLGWMVRDGGPLAGPDRRLVVDLNAWTADVAGLVAGLVGSLKAVTLLGDPITLYLIVGLGIGLAWRRGRTRPCLFVAITALSAGAANSLLKVLVDRPRPVLDDPMISAYGRSFPSGHALGATVTYGAILVAVWPLLTPRARRCAVVVVVVLAVSIGASRVLLGVHHLSDVVAGYLLALAWLAGALALSSRGRSGRGSEQPARGHGAACTSPDR